MYNYLRMHVYACMNICMYVCIYVCMYANIYVYMCVPIQEFIGTYT